ncbi:acetylserotonin O-methyltransferase 2 isoform X2 [Salvelinus alpinus]|uniref:acetylserotonin O-methyltransferase 2 isoform X2 n=1 Tax=Salvelinus alpinus TaxID=8036 RepID=UPI0039FCC8BE
MAEHLSQSELDYPFKLLEYFNGFRVSKVIFSACELGVFDLLLLSQKPLSAELVAQELGASVDGIERLLDVLVGVDILEVEQIDGTACYSSTDVANLYLAKGSAKSLHDMIIYQSQTIYPLWNNMVHAVREGKNQNEKTFGISPEDIFQTIYRSEEEMLKFMGLMNSTWILDGHDIVTAFDLSCFKAMVDLGGCSGALARELSKAYPSSSVTVLDLPTVIQTARQHFSEQDDTIVFQEGGGVLLVEALLFENRRGPVMAQIFSLNMLVQTEGKEHPPSQYSNMLSFAGFHNVQVCRTGKSYDAILAIK